MRNQETDHFDLRFAVEGLLLGGFYGLGFRLLANFRLLGSTAVMSIGFLFVCPMIMGILAVRRASKVRRAPIWLWFLLPAGTVCLATVCAMLLYLEGAICVVFAFPIALTGGILGGIIGGISIQRSVNASASLTSCVAALPLLCIFIEGRITPQMQIRTVTSQVRIHSDAATIWKNIERVPAITPSELRSTWTHRIGFPRPVEATLSHEGVGGVRHASFEHGLLFIETVTVWEPERRLGFSIKADSANIPPTTLDEHVTIGGPYFDVLDGEYWLEPVGNGDTVLHLVSHQRLSTDFNGYAGLWTSAVMQNLQSSILDVIRHRCEQA